MSDPATAAANFLNLSTSTLLSPKSTKGISGFVFDIDLVDTLHLQADITDHYVENNSFVNDHVVIKPVEFTLTGFVGELVWTAPTGLLAAANAMSSSLSEISGFMGNYSPGFAQQAAQIATEAAAGLAVANELLNAAGNTIGYIGSLFGPNLTKQQKAFANLYSLMASKTIVTVLTPWAYFDSMLIKDVQFVQDETTQDRTEITVLLKEFRPAATPETVWSNSLSPNANQVQSADPTQIGTVQSDDGNTALYDLANNSVGVKKLTGMVGQ